MCRGRPECQKCLICGMAAWKFWSGDEMHPRGCPHGDTAPCQDAKDRAGILQFLVEAGSPLTEKGMAFLTDMERRGCVSRSDRPAVQTGGIQ